MDNIIDKLLEIDRSAREMVENASKQRESSIANLAAVKKEIDMTAMNEAAPKRKNTANRPRLIPKNSKTPMPLSMKRTGPLWRAPTMPAAAAGWMPSWKTALG